MNRADRIRPRASRTGPTRPRSSSRRRWRRSPTPKSWRTSLPRRSVPPSRAGMRSCSAVLAAADPPDQSAPQRPLSSTRCLVRLSDWFRFSGASLAQVDRGTDEHGNGEELTLPVLERLEPELRGSDILPDVHRLSPMLQLLLAVRLGAACGMRGDRGEEQQKEQSRKASARKAARSNRLAARARVRSGRSPWSVGPRPAEAPRPSASTPMTPAGTGRPSAPRTSPSARTHFPSSRRWPRRSLRS